LPKTSAKFPQSDLEIEIVIKNRGVQITAKGTITKLSKQAKAIQQFATILATGSSEPQASAEEPGSPDTVSTSETPVIKVSNSTIDNIRSLFQMSWGREPRNVDQVSAALSANGVPESDAQIGVALLRLVKSGMLRRIKKNLKWHYYRIPQ